MSLLINQQSPDPKWRAWVLVTILVLALVCLCVLQGCVTEKQRQKICRNCSHTDSVSIVKRDTVILRDTTLVLNIQGDTITMPCPTHDTVIVKRYKGIKTEIRYLNNQVQCICADDSLLLVIQKIRADHFAEINSTKQETFVTNDCPETWWQKTYRYGFWIMLPLIVFYVGWKGLGIIAQVAKKFP